MKIHEYQAKALFTDFNIPTPEGRVAETPDQAYDIAKSLGGGRLMVKAQIHAGGRGKGGGVKVVDSPDQVREAASEILGMNLITHQTGPKGQTVRKALIEKASAIKKEFYVGLTLDRDLAQPVIMASPEGGVEIEEVAEKSPELIFKESVDPRVGFQQFQGRNLALGLGLKGKLLRQGAQLFANLYDLYISIDASLAEINPLVLTEDDQLIALDGKINLDDNGLFRHPELKDLLDPYELDPLELEADKHNLNYIRLDGNIGAMVNGAGLAMATMDLIKQAGAEPANFLDVGGGASAEMIANGISIILSDPRVEALLINIFGGILRCDVLAQGVIDAAGRKDVNVPIIVRLQGTNATQGSRMLNESGLDFVVAEDLSDAAKKIAALVS